MMIPSIDDVLRDLVDEYDRIDSILGSLTTEQWLSPSGAPGWSVADTVLHLAQSESGVASTLTTPTSEWHTRDHPLDEAMNNQVKSSSLGPAQIFSFWQDARRSSVAALAQADPSQSFRWAAAPLRPRTLATTRLAEHWAHALDITGPLGISYADTDRLRHIAWLGHATFPYALQLAGLAVHPVLCTLTSPSGQPFVYGPADASSHVSGSMSAFCRVGARRLDGDDSGLTTNGPEARSALKVLRNYAA
jgi:uncharacterized protein (TIGR03084 family)